MPVPTDFVARFVDVDLELVQRRRALGAACVAPRRLVRQAMLENDAVRARGAWVTVGSEGDRNALTLHDGRSGDGVEVPVADFGSARRFMEQIGFTAVAHRESYREEWRLQHIAFTLSDWPGLPRSLEINGPQEEHVRWAAQNLGLDFAHAVIGPDQFAGFPRLRRLRSPSRPRTRPSSRWPERWRKRWKNSISSISAGVPRPGSSPTSSG